MPKRNQPDRVDPDEEQTRQLLLDLEEAAKVGDEEAFEQGRVKLIETGLPFANLLTERIKQQASIRSNERAC
jgi:hypothetical protein